VNTSAITRRLLMSFTDDLLTEASIPRAAQHLALDSLVMNPRLARRLPPALAFRYHALPVAEDKGRITVAMADPDDAIARAAVAAALGTRLYVVQADPAAIDGLLAETWPEETRHALRLLIYHQTSHIADEVQAYAQYLRGILDGDLSYFQTVSGANGSFDDLAQAWCDHDLVILGEPDQSMVERLSPGPAHLRVAKQVPTSVLIARRPRWPLRRLLLVIRDQEADDIAVDWTARLAQPSGANITVLAIVPQMPAMCNQAAGMQHGLAEWLATDTALGRQMRRIARRLVNWESKGTLRFRQGPPDWQIQCEVSEGDYDLIVIAADPPGHWLRRLLGELVNPLLHRVDRPVLIAKSPMI
jgi:nucleotide-binding universal stress UspA family protein